MAFSPTSVTPIITHHAGRKVYAWVWTTAEGAAASEVILAKAPKAGMITRAVQEHDSGSATTHQPQITIVTAGTETEIVYQATSTAVATNVDDPGAANQPIPYVLDSGESLFHKSVPNSGSDNVFNCRVYVVEGH